MLVDPFRLSIALVPLAAYLLLMALVNLRRRPFLTSGGSDLAALGVALSGLAFVGPLDLFRPEAATAEFGNYIWPIMLIFYWLWVLLVVLVARPRDERMKYENHLKKTFGAATLEVRPQPKKDDMAEVFINGEFVGGCDIVTELKERGELDKLISK